MSTDSQTQPTPTAPTPPTDPGDAPRVVRTLPPESIRRSPYQVRRDAPPDPALVQSIAVFGLLNPITVRPDADGEHYELIAGHRRLAAWRTARPDEPVPAIVLDADDLAAEDLLVAENLIRQDLCAMEVALTVAQLRAHGRTVPQVAEAVRHSERWVYRYSGVAEIGEPWRSHAIAMRVPLEPLLALAALDPARRACAWDDYVGRAARAAGMNYSEKSGHLAEARAWRQGVEGAAGDRAAWERALCSAGAEGGEAAAASCEIWWTANDGLARIARAMEGAGTTQAPPPTDEPKDDDEDDAEDDAPDAAEDRPGAKPKAPPPTAVLGDALALEGALRAGALWMAAWLLQGRTLDDLLPDALAMSVGARWSDAEKHGADDLLALERALRRCGAAPRTRASSEVRPRDAAQALRNMAVNRMRPGHAREYCARRLKVWTEAAR